MTSAVEVVIDPPSVVEIVIESANIVEVEVPGIQGPTGLSGNSSVGGYDVTVSSPSTGDILTFGADRWVNAAASFFADGGNF